MPADDHENHGRAPPPGGVPPGTQDQLFDQLYGELRRIARRYMGGERPNHTLQPTALVNEAYLRLAAAKPLQIQDRAHFLRLAASTMRRILVDRAREKKAAKRGGGLTLITLTDGLVARGGQPTFDLIALDEALTKLAKLSERQAAAIELRYFVGMSVDEVASELGMSPRTVKSDTRVAKAWLRRELS